MHSQAKQYSTQGHQGDVRFRLVPRSSMPADVREATKTKDGAFIVTHSETGHHHLVDATEAVLYETADPFIAYLMPVDGAESATVRHAKTGEHVHGEASLKNPGSDWVWRVSRQREWTPESIRAAAD